MDRIVESETFLNSVLHATAYKRKKLLQNCTEQELKAIVECIINVNNLKNLGDSELKCIKKCKSVIAYFNKKSRLSVTRVKTFLKQNHSLVAALLSCVLLRLFEEAVYCVYNGDDSSHDPE